MPRNSHLYCAVARRLLDFLRTSSSQVSCQYRHRRRLLTGSSHKQSHFNLTKHSIITTTEVNVAATTLHRSYEFPTELQMLIWKAPILNDNLGLVVDEVFLGRIIFHSVSSDSISRTSVLSKSFFQCTSTQTTVHGNMSYLIDRWTVLPTGGIRVITHSWRGFASLSVLVENSRRPVVCLDGRFWRLGREMFPLSILLGYVRALVWMLYRRTGEGVLRLFLMNSIDKQALHRS